MPDSTHHGNELRRLIEQANLTQSAALARFNTDQARPLSLSQWKAYLAAPSSSRFSPCPESVLVRMKTLLEP